METNDSVRKPQNRKLVWVFLSLGVILGLGAIFVFWYQPSRQAVAATPATYKTTVVRRGNIILSATGSGSLSAGQEINLSFPVSGKVASINVQVGDRVSEGQVLAELADQTSLEAAVASAKVDLMVAEQELQDLQNNAQAALATARQELVSAQEAYDTAKNEAKQKGWRRCDEDTTKAYLGSYEKLTERLDWYTRQYDGNFDPDFYLNVIEPLKNQINTAYANYLYCSTYTDAEIESSQAALAVAEATLNQAKAKLQKLEANQGVDPVELAQAQNKVTTARLALETAQKNLEGAVIRAPFAGVVMAVNGQAGDTVSANTTLITLADLAHPIVNFSIDETDMDKVVIGGTAEVTFDAIPDVIFNGTVSRLNPSLETVSGYQVLTGVIKLDPGDHGNQLLEGLNATVEIIAGKAENVLIIPIEALRDLGDGQYAVFVIGQDGKPRLKTVEIGLKDSSFVEIKNGLQQGEVVTTGNVETQ